MDKLSGAVLTTLVMIAGLCLPADATAIGSAERRAGIAYQDTGHDPAGDQAQAEPDVDIRRTTRTVFRSHRTRYLRLAVRGHRNYARSLGSGLRVEARLDVRGSSGWDYKLVMNLGDSGSDIKDGCYLFKRGAPRKAPRTHLRIRESGAMACDVEMRKLHARHHVRWWLLAYDYEGESADYSGLTDHAPDRGWYP